MSAIGYHISLSQFNRTTRLEDCCNYIINNNLSAFQIFSKNSRSKTSKITFDVEDVLNAKKIIKQNNLIAIIHTPYAIHLAHEDISDGIYDSVLEDMEFAYSNKFYTCVLHMSKQLGLDIGEATENMRKNLENIVRHFIKNNTRVSDRIISLEIMSGNGTGILSDIEELGSFYRSLRESVRVHVKFCLDSAHLWANGYDLSTKDSVKRFLKLWNNEIGIENISMIHLNGSLADCDSHRDLHAILGSPEDKITTTNNEGMNYFIKFLNKYEIPIIFEVEENMRQVKYVKKILNR